MSRISVNSCASIPPLRVPPVPMKIPENKRFLEAGWAVRQQAGDEDVPTLLGHKILRPVRFA